tara:strand:- start:2389 stop:3258 length:870 start_codon:yes stop_codon:yes gene_type:complete
MKGFEKIGKDCTISVNNLEVGSDVIIGNNVTIICDSFKIGRNSVIGDNVTITCNKFECGDWLFMTKGVEIGRGGCNGPNSNVKIGNHVGIFENTIINPSETVEIGDNVGIGAEVMIWTHGAWLDVMKGFPSDFGPVKIGNDVWLPARSIVLPNVEIEDNIVIGIGSIINRSLPKGCFAAGSPCKVIKENCYPKELDKIEKKTLVFNILRDWKKLHKYKGGFDCFLEYNENWDYIKLVQFDYSPNNGQETIFDLKNRTISGGEDEVSEDLRDYLRRRGIKIFTDKPFKSI